MIAKGYKENFQTLLKAINAGDACLVECADVKTGKPVIVIAATSTRKDGSAYLTPLAKMFDGNPYAELLPPSSPALEVTQPDGGANG